MNLTLPTELTTRSGSVRLREATTADLRALVGLLADDPVSAARGDVAASEDLDAYARGLTDILEDPSNTLLVAVDGDDVVGTLQLTSIPGMARRGARRLQVEAVRVRSDRRSDGVGSAMMRWVADVAAVELRCGLVQLTSDTARTDAHRFYERLGYVGSHTGFKLRVDQR